MPKKIWLPKTVRDAFNKPKPQPKPQPKSQNDYAVDVMLVNFKTCPTCGKSFKPFLPSQRYCSRKCRPENQPKYCLYCGNQLPKLHGHNRNKFCNDDCKLHFMIKAYAKQGEKNGK